MTDCISRAGLAEKTVTCIIRSHHPHTVSRPKCGLVLQMLQMLNIAWSVSLWCDVHKWLN